MVLLYPLNLLGGPLSAPKMNMFIFYLQINMQLNWNDFVISAKFTGWPTFGVMYLLVDRGWPIFPSNYFVK